MAETAAGQVVGTVGLQQKIPFPGKRGSRALIALRQADAMRAELSVQELALAERIRNTYWNSYAANRTVAIVSESKGLLVTLRESVETRVAANNASQQDLLVRGLRRRSCALGQRSGPVHGNPRHDASGPP